ncbi:MAG: hypothetical protein HOY71_27695 [Nonomuraea sp.]|nr:hypothetical protein [Nonomuraea sp.]
MIVLWCERGNDYAAEVVINSSSAGSKDVIRRLPTGRLGDSAYGLEFRSRFPGGGLEHGGNVGEFDPVLTIPTTRTAVPRPPV